MDQTRPTSLPSGDASPPPVVSVVIITRHRAEVLAECLDHLRKARDDRVEVIVVDNSDVHRTDTREAALSCADVRYIRMHPCRNCLTLGRNLGVANASGELIAFFDDDSLVEPDWFEVCRASFADPEIGAAGGRVLDPEVDDLDHQRTAEIGKLLPNGAVTDNLDCDPGRIVEVHHVRGCNWALRRSVYEEVGWYDEDLFGYAYEELDLSIRVRQLGYRIIFNPALQIYHKLRPREGDERRRLSPVRKRKLSMILSYIYAKDFGPFSAVYLRFLLTYRTHVVATARSPSWTNLRILASGTRGKLDGLARYLALKSRLKASGAAPRLSSPAYRKVRF